MQVRPGNPLGRIGNDAGRRDDPAGGFRSAAKEKRKKKQWKEVFGTHHDITGGKGSIHVNVG
jgi:hypothetical protein